MSNKPLFLKPRLSEQTYALAQKQRIYVFDVPKDANKNELSKAVAEQFKVTVETVNVAKVYGKPKRVISVTGKRRSNSVGRRNDIKKAYVKLATGFSLPLFEAIEEAEEKERNIQEKVDKSAAKEAKQEKTKKPGIRGINILSHKKEEQE